MTVEDEKITGNHPFKLVPPDIHKVEGAEQLPQIVEYLKRAEQLRQGLGSIIGLWNSLV